MSRKLYSLIQDMSRCECYKCNRQDKLELHHIVYGTANRRLSDEYGCVVFLCTDHHRGLFGVHGKYGHELDMELKTKCQEAFERKFSHEKWMEVFGKSYL